MAKNKLRQRLRQLAAEQDFISGIDNYCDRAGAGAGEAEADAKEPSDLDDPAFWPGVVAVAVAPARAGRVDSGLRISDSIPGGASDAKPL